MFAKRACRLEGSGRDMDADRILGCAAPIVGMGGKKPPGDNAVKLLETDAFRSAFVSVSAHLLEGATDRVLTGSTNAGHSGDDKAAERSAQARKRIPRPVELLRAHHCHGSAPETFNVRSEMITRCKLNIQKYRETIAALEERAGK